MTWRIWSPVGSTSSSNASFERSFSSDAASALERRMPPPALALALDASPCRSGESGRPAVLGRPPAAADRNDLHPQQDVVMRRSRGAQRRFPTIRGVSLGETCRARIRCVSYLQTATFPSPD